MFITWVLHALEIVLQAIVFATLVGLILLFCYLITGER